MIVTREDVRIKLTTRIEELRAAWTDYPLVVSYDNTLNVNLSMQTEPYLLVSMLYHTGVQAGVGKSGANRAIGNISLDVRVREGTGTSKSNKLLDFMFRPLQRTDDMFPLRTFAAGFSSTPARDGWASQAALIPFWFDSD